MSEETKIPATLSIKNVLFLFVYYFILLFITVSLTINILYNHYLNVSNSADFIENFNTILTGCISFSICASCIYYIRKLYKLSLSDKITISSNKTNLIHLGTLCYFIIRPWFAGVFSIILFLGLNSGILIVNGNNNHPTNRLMDLYIFSSFFVGFSSGKFLHFIENKSGELINSFSTSKPN